MRIFLATELEQRSAQPEAAEYVAYEWVPIEEIDQRIRMGALENGTLLAAWCIFRATINLSGAGLPALPREFNPPADSADI